MPATPRYIQTIPRRGYRFCASLNSGSVRHPEVRRSSRFSWFVAGFMTLPILVLAVCVVIGLSVPSSAQAQHQLPQRFSHTLKSEHVNQEFEIHVQVPLRAVDGNQRFPVLYETDATAGLMMPGIASIMQLAGEVRPYISVGIGYPGNSFEAGLALRVRDLTPSSIDAFDAENRYPFEGLEIPEQAQGGARNFARFIEQELIPFIDAQYPTQAGERGYWGDSLGGLFGLYVMFNHPELFNRYVIGSPSTWWDDELIMSQAEAFVVSEMALNAKVYIAAGALEELGPRLQPQRMVTNVYRLDEILSVVPGLDLKVRIFPDETHTSVPPLNYTHGIRYVFSKPAQSVINR